MKKIKEIFKKIRYWYRGRKLYKLAELDASMMCSPLVRLLPPEVFIEGDPETILRETQRIAQELREKYGPLGMDRQEPKRRFFRRKID